MQAATTQTTTLKITNQEAQIITHCAGKEVVSWEELAQYAKEPTTVKLKTLQKAVSDLKKKYRDANLPMPLNCSFVSLVSLPADQETKPSPVPVATTQLQADAKPEQKLVQLRITRGGNRVPADDKTPDAHIDFKLEPFHKRVRTRTNIINLSDNEWELFKLFHSNLGKKFSVEDLKDVVYKNFGSKTPHNWADAIGGTLTKLRTNIRELKTNDRLLTIRGSNITYYMFE